MNLINNCALKKVVNSTALWPASLNRPLASVTSYVFKSQENTQKFMKFMRENLPGVEVKIRRNDKEMYIVNLTNLTKDCGNGGQYVGNDTKKFRALCIENGCKFYYLNQSFSDCYCG